MCKEEEREGWENGEKGKKFPRIIELNYVFGS